MSGAEDTAALGRPLSPIEQRLAEIGEQRAQLAKAKAAREEARAGEDKLRQAERTLAREQAVDEAEEKYGAIGEKILIVSVRDGDVIVKRPPAALYKRFRDRRADEPLSQAYERLVRPCVVFPSLAAFDRILEEQQGALDLVADAVVQLAGLRAEDLAGK